MLSREKLPPRKTRKNETSQETLLEKGDDITTIEQVEKT
jgi:hypothetical protein